MTSGRWRRRLATVLAGAAITVAAPGAQADDAAVAAALGRARAERAALRYRAALDATAAALAVGRASPAQLVEVYRLAGELAAGLDEPSAAERWFARWLALVPDARLPADASPKLRAPLAAARAQLAGQALGLVVTPGAGGVLRLTVAHDVLGLVARVRLRAADGGAGQDGLPGSAFAAAPGVELIAAAVDAHGNELIVQPARAPAALGAPAGYARWQPWAGATVVLAAAGGAFAWRSAVAQDEFDRLRADSAAHTFAELEAVRRRGERHALVANVGFGLAAATAVTAVVLVVRGADAAGGGDVALAPWAASDGAGLTLAGRW